MQRSDKRGFKIYASADQAHQDQRIGRIVAGDREAFRALVCDYHPLAYSLAFKTLNNRQDAEEVVQDAFVKIYHALDGFRGEASLKTWILRIVLRLSLNRRRDRARTAWHRLGLNHRNAESEEDPGNNVPIFETPESICISREGQRCLRQMVDELPESLRQALVLNSFDELSYEEIACILDIPLGTVSSRIYSGRKKLLKKLENSDLF